MAREPHANVTPVHAALLYASMGWPVLPLHAPTRTGCSCRRSSCSSVGKHPRLRNGVYDATTDLDRIEQLWMRWPDANVGIATGAIVVIDVDGHLGRTGIEELQELNGGLPRTCAVATGRGFHLYFDAAGLQLGNGASALPPGVHVRGYGGCVAAPPSRHPSGCRYRWIRGSAPAALPDWLGKALTSASSERAPLRLVVSRGRSGYVERALDGEIALVRAAPVGSRNTTLNRAAFRLGQLAGAGMTTLDELREPLLHAARSAGLPDLEARATIASGLHPGALRPRLVGRPGPGTG